MEHYDYCQGKIKQIQKCVCFNLAGNLEAYVVEIFFLSDLEESVCYAK